MTFCKNFKDVSILLMIFLVLINLIAYFISGESSYFFQDLLSKQVYGDKTFAILDQWALLIIGLLLLINLAPKGDSIHYQKYLLLMLCALSPLIPMTVGFYPLISGVSNVIVVLTNAWIQLFCPSTIRGTVAGILTASNGLQDIVDTTIENFRTFDIEAIHMTGFCMFLCALGVIWQLKKTNLRSIEHQHLQAMQLSGLLHQYLFIFLSCVLVGVNSGVFYYTYSDARMILPQENPQKFQYMVNVVSILSPFIFGFITDRFGYMKTQMQCFYWITVVHFLNFLVKILKVQNTFVLFFLSFWDCVFANCLQVSIIAICGHYLLKQGIFRSFALYGIAYSLGNFFCDLIFEKYSPNFGYYQIALVLMNILSLVFILKSFKNFQKQENLI